MHLGSAILRVSRRSASERDGSPDGDCAPGCAVFVQVSFLEPSRDNACSMCLPSLKLQLGVWSQVNQPFRQLGQGISEVLETGLYKKKRN